MVIKIYININMKLLNPVITILLPNYVAIILENPLPIVMKLAENPTKSIGFYSYGTHFP